MEHGNLRVGGAYDPRAHPGRERPVGRRRLRVRGRRRRGGGRGLRFATLKTDKDDYAPGEPALITGSGWQPGEEVTLVFQEDPAVHPDYMLTLTANGEGNISHDEWAPEEHDFGVRFYLMATGVTSQRRAQITFTDSGSFSYTTASGKANTATLAPGATNSTALGVNVDAPKSNGLFNVSLTFA